MELTDPELYERAAEDGEAFGVLYDRHERSILTFFLRQTRSAELAADLTAETFASLLVARRRNTPITDPRAWLYATARNALVDAHRRGTAADAMRRRLALERVVPDEDALRRIEALDLDEDRLAMHQLAALPGDQRAAIEARVLEDRSYDEIAELLRCTPATARQRVSRGLSFLRRRLQEQR
jgi:RNA polymerase sigma factor (sigma-70 family)